MLASSVVQQISLKIFMFIMSLFYAVNGAVVPPPTTDVIDTKRDGAEMVFATVADPQVSNYMFDRYVAFQESVMDLQNAACKFDAIVGIGDIAENGLAEEYQLVYDELSKIDSRFIMATGNHDIRLRSYKQVVDRFTKFTNALNGDEAMTKLAYSETVNGYKFIVMGTDRTEMEEAYISPEQLAWLDSEIASVKAGDPVFVICHQPLKLTHGLPTTWGSGTNKTAGSVGKQSDDIKAVLAKYASEKTVILLTGHLHAGFADFNFEEIEGFYSVNIPALSIENKDGKVNGSGLTYICEVYDNEVLFRARDLRNGKWLSEFDYSIKLK